ncbi:hypothetical protein DXG01_007375 [Tephrocybe rancida]|nr:hypothetical protein DXG01_007375 [Tephrocybe rancida]
MVFYLAALVFGGLALGPQVVLSSLNFTFALSEVKQCEPLSITFTGDSNTSPTPLSLTLVPFNSQSTPVSLPISNTSSDIFGVYVTFVPFPANTTFLASLDDASGENVAEVSGIVRVLPSPTGNVSCLPKRRLSTVTETFTVDNSTFSQCENFSVHYNPTVSHAPSVRIYNPEGPSQLLNLTNDDNTTGTATYLLSSQKSKQVVLVFDNGLGQRQSSEIMTDDLNGLTIEPASDGDSTPSKISPSVVIGASVGGGLVALIACCMLFFVCRERRRRRRADIEYGDALIDKRGPREFNEKDSIIRPSGDGPGFVKNPLYTTGSYSSRDSMASWAQPTPDDDSFSYHHRSSAVENGARGDDSVSLNSLDIEGMLNVAAVPSSHSSTQTVGPTILDSELQVQVTRPSPSLSRQHTRSPSDVPFGPESMASAISLTSVVDPFADHALKRQGQLGMPPSRQNSAKVSIRSPPPALRDLPSLRRDGSHIRRERGSNVSGVPQDATSPIVLDVVFEDRLGSSI